MTKATFCVCELEGAQLQSSHHPLASFQISPPPFNNGQVVDDFSPAPFSVCPPAHSSVPKLGLFLTQEQISSLTQALGKNKKLPFLF